MKTKQLILALVAFTIDFHLSAQQVIWSETFDIPDKGYWGNDSGTVNHDMSGITKWTLDVSGCSFADASDYIKTVSTSGGRMQAIDINGEAIWKSQTIDISGFPNINISINVSETGSSTSTTKYIKLYYQLDDKPAILFDTNGENIGNFGNTLALQSEIIGKKLQIVILINNPNASDACIIDNLEVSCDNSKPQVASVSAINSNTLQIFFSKKMNQIDAENINNFSVTTFGNPTLAVLDADKKCVKLVFSCSFIENQNYSVNISEIADLSGNKSSIATITFLYIRFKLEEIYVSSPFKLYLEFSHGLDPSSIANVSNYSIDNAIGYPASAELINDTIISLNFTNNFTNNTNYRLNINKIGDKNGNIISVDNIDFSYHQALKYDLVINEIMSDPSPPVTLPEFEYIELYNRTSYDICLYNWEIYIGSKKKHLPLSSIKANSLLILTSSEGSAFLKDFGKSVGILGTSDLTNSGKPVSLYTNQGRLIDSIYYTKEWYLDEQKGKGGWSIERIDPDNTCSHQSNWKAAIDDSGGTPGKINSVDAENKDVNPPKLISLSISDSMGIIIAFDEELQTNNLQNIENYLLDQSIRPVFASLVKGETKHIALLFSDKILQGIHQLSISNISDLCNNSIAQIDTAFTNYNVNTFDILINEIMLDISPAPHILPAHKYIELYNKTKYNIDLNGYLLQITDNNPIILHDLIIPANDYLIICASSQTEIFRTYGNVAGILQESQLIEKSGAISLFTPKGNLIDYVNYSNIAYGNPEKSNGGWSLERIDFNNFCSVSKNWTASIDFKGGTPGKRNSVNRINPDTLKPKLINISILSSNKLSLSFSKNLTIETALFPGNYILDNGNNCIEKISFADTSRSTVILQCSKKFPDNQEQIIQINNLKDFCGNTFDPALKKFTYYLIHPISAFAESEKIVHLIFSEEVEIASAQTTSNFQMNNGLSTPLFATKHPTQKKEIYIELSGSMINAENYTVHIENVRDLNGNIMKPADVSLIYYVPLHNNLIINEILFNPRPSGVDFVEIYNKSGYPVDLSKTKLATRDEEGKLESIKPLSLCNLLYQNAHFLAITSDSIKIKNEYPAISYDKFLQISSMPAFNDDEGTIVLLYGDSVLDELRYNANMHFKLINNPEGVSLERIDPERETQLETNWHSAAESKGFATPANQNSQFRKFLEDINEEIVVEPETFSPNSDGYNDVVFIRYKSGEPGYIGNLSIFDAKGRLVKSLASNELLATEGEFYWDGLFENGTKANIGIYVIYFEFFNLKGTVKKFKKVCVLADKLK